MLIMNYSCFSTRRACGIQHRSEFYFVARVCAVRASAYMKALLVIVVLYMTRHQTVRMASLTAHSTATSAKTCTRCRILRAGQEISVFLWILKFDRYYKSLHQLLFCVRCIHCTLSDTPQVGSNNIRLLTPWFLRYQGANGRSSRCLSTIISCQ